MVSANRWLTDRILSVCSKYNRRLAIKNTLCDIVKTNLDLIIGFKFWISFRKSVFQNVNNNINELIDLLQY